MSQKKAVMPMSSTPGPAIQESFLNRSGVYCVPRRAECSLEEICSIPFSPKKISCDFGQAFKARHLLGGHSLHCSGNLHPPGVCFAGYPRIRSAVTQSCNLKSVQGVL